VKARAFFLTYCSQLGLKGKCQLKAVMRCYSFHTSNNEAIYALDFTFIANANTVNLHCHTTDESCVLYGNAYRQGANVNGAM